MAIERAQFNEAKGRSAAKDGDAVAQAAGPAQDREPEGPLGRPILLFSVLHFDGTSHPGDRRDALRVAG